MTDKPKSIDDTQWLKWQLEELAAAEDIEGDELDIHGETEQGIEGVCTVKITDIASRALSAIKSLQLDLGLMEAARDHRARLLLSCEAALAERDEKILKLTSGRCQECNGTGEILQNDGSDSSGTLITCECRL
jgi:hypothetical protein